jgi:hypothetical protein
MLLLIIRQISIRSDGLIRKLFKSCLRRQWQIQTGSEWGGFPNLNASGMMS